MEETFDQKVIRNVQGKFAVYKTTEVVGDKSLVPNIEWENPDDVDSFFAFANKLGASVIYVTEGEEFNEETNQSKTSILQVGFIHQGIMHNINVADEDDDEDDEEYEDDDEYEEEGTVQHEQPIQQPQYQQQF